MLKIKIFTVKIARASRKADANRIFLGYNCDVAQKAFVFVVSWTAFVLEKRKARNQRGELCIFP